MMNNQNNNIFMNRKYYPNDFNIRQNQMSSNDFYYNKAYKNYMFQQIPPPPSYNYPPNYNYPNYLQQTQIQPLNRYNQNNSQTKNEKNKLKLGGESYIPKSMRETKNNDETIKLSIDAEAYIPTNENLRKKEEAIKKEKEEKEKKEKEEKERKEKEELIIK